MTTDIATITDSNKNLVRRTFCPTATADEFEMFRAICNRYGLDPFCREAWFVKYGGSQAQIFIGRDGMLAIAHRSGQFDGMETKPTFDENRNLISATCIVWRKDMTHPFTKTVYLWEYSTNRSLWLTKPITMLQKVAEAQALRAAFSISGLYCQEEMGVDEPIKIVDDEPCIGIKPVKEDPQKEPEPVKETVREEPAPKKTRNLASLKQMTEIIIPTYLKDHLDTSALEQANLGNGFYDKDMIDADYKRQMFSEKPPASSPTTVIPEKQTAPSVTLSGEVCEVCGAKLLAGDVPTSRNFCDGHLFCEKHQREYLQRKRKNKP